MLYSSFYFHHISNIHNSLLKSLLEREYKSIRMSYYYTQLVLLIFVCWVLEPHMSRGNEVISPHCQQKCGNIDIPWPFGIGDGCFFKESHNITDFSFKIQCNQSGTSPPTPIFGTNLEIENISILEGEIRVRMEYVAYRCYNKSGSVYDGKKYSLNLESFTISSLKNNLIAIGCDTYALFTGFRHNKMYETGCMTTCVELNDAIDGECSGIGCCQSPLPTGVKNVTVKARSFSNHTSVYSFNPCSAAFLVAKDSFKFSISSLTQNFSADHKKMRPVVLSWSIGLKNCSKAEEDGSCLCKQNSECYDMEYESGYRCKCKHGYAGNPYMPRGCIDIDECKQENDCEKAAYCYNRAGGYYCKCPKGYHGDGTTSSPCISNRKPWLIPVLATAGFRHGKMYETGCLTSCMELNDANDGECSGIGCCQSSLPTGVKNVNVNARSFYNHISVYSFNPCSVAFPVAKDAFIFYKSNLTRNFSADHSIMLPVVLNWSIGLKNCSKANEDGSCLCKQNAKCVDVEYQMGYRCQCKHGYGGNPYMPQGCIDIDECKQENNCEKAAYCYNTAGSYYCKCPKGYHGDGTTSSPCNSNRKSWLVPVLVTAGIGGGIITLLVIGFILYWKHGEHKVKKMRESFFRENGGFLLHEILTRRNIKTLIIFTMKDLETATNNYSEKNIIGRGGFGIVHKGILPNGQLVAIKRSLKVDPNQVEQFINEILVLSQINNKNVVMLLGCCLESEVPLLVYEFINNGTLYEHLHDSVKASFLKWPLRLRIASEIANVLSYLHNTISTPIIHRDVKSLNVLLDACYTAKVIDFGASKLILSDQKQFATMVVGTRGYLDPEYMQTSELTSKSDVYSFGVVLVELLTRLNAFSNIRQESEKCLAMHFLLKMKDGRLMEIIDENILNDGTVEQIQQVANLAKWCLMLKGEDRPTMKEVFIELETIKERGSHPWRENNKYTKEDCQILLGETSTSCEGGYSSFCIDSDLYEPLSSLGKGR